MAKKKKEPVVTEQGERAVVMFRDTNRYFHCLLWYEILNGQKHCIHFVYTESNGQVYHAVATINDEKHIMDRIGSTTPRQFEEYLKGRLLKYGGNAAAYEALGVPKPEQPTEAAPDRTEAHDDLYRRAAAVLGMPEKALRDKYGHLNPGLQMMNLRNRMRAKGVKI